MELSIRVAFYHLISENSKKEGLFSLVAMLVEAEQDGERRSISKSPLSMRLI